MKTRHLFIALAAMMLVGAAMPTQAQKKVKKTNITSTETKLNNEQKQVLSIIYEAIKQVQESASAKDLFNVDNYMRCNLYEIQEKHPKIFTENSNKTFQKKFGDAYSMLEEELEKKMIQLGIEKNDLLYQSVRFLHGT